MKTKLVFAALLAAAALAPAQAAITVHTGTFLTSVTQYNGFEGIGSTTSYPGTTPYTEEGITVVYVTPLTYAPNVWTDSQIMEGNYVWYLNNGSNGYTDVTFAATDAIQFAVGSGWFSGGGNLQYEVLNAGSVIATGAILNIAAYTGIDSAFGYYGFSGATFDEIHLQVAQYVTDFNPNYYEAGAYDAFSIGTVGAVPEPETYAMMLAGLGLLGFAARRRKQLAA